MPDKPGITIQKQMPWKDKPNEVWGNHYFFSGTVPSNDAEWLELATALWDAERTMLASNVTCHSAYGYAAGNPNSVFQHSWVTDGPTPTPGLEPGGVRVPGLSAGWVRWWTGERNRKSRRIYCRKYFHGINVLGGETIALTVRAAMQTYAALMIDGSLPGGFRVCGPQGAVCRDPYVPVFIGEHELRRRGKRPH